MYAGQVLTGRALHQLAHQVATTHGVQYAVHPVYQGYLKNPTTGEGAYMMIMFVNHRYDLVPLMIPISVDCWALVESSFKDTTPRTCAEFN